MFLTPEEGPARLTQLFCTHSFTGRGPSSPTPMEMFEAVNRLVALISIESGWVEAVEAYKASLAHSP